MMASLSQEVICVQYVDGLRFIMRGFVKKMCISVTVCRFLGRHHIDEESLHPKQHKSHTAPMSNSVT